MAARYPVDPGIYHNALVKFSPFTQLFLALRQAGNNLSILLVLGIVLIFAFTGRGFCGWVCPVGAGLDIYNRLGGHKFRRKNRDVRKELLGWKYYILIASVICLVFGVSVYWLIDPTAMFTRNTALVVDPVIDTAVRETTRALSGIPNFGYEIEKAMRTVFNPLPVRSLYFWFFLGLLISAFLLEILALRFFCKVLCPLGGLLGYLVNISPIKLKIDHTACISCNLCLKACKTSALSSRGQLSVDDRECVFCLACIEACEYTGLSVQMERPFFERNVDSYSRGRRDLIRGSLGALVLIPIYKAVDFVVKRPKNLIRPPGALHEGVFTQVCAKCGSCMKVCYTSGIQPVLLEGGLDSLFTPRMDFNNGFCGFDCIDCGNVCPTGALKPLTLKQKREVIMGVAVIDRELCLPWGEKKGCLTCEEVCPVHKKAIELENRLAIFDDGTEKIIKLPFVIEENCIGCGICVKFCPVVDPEKAIVVEYEGETRGGEVRSKQPRDRREGFVTEEKTYWDD